MADIRAGEAAEPRTWRFGTPRLGSGERLAGWAFIAPALILLGIFMIYPIFWSLWMSFQVGKGMNFSFGGFAPQRFAAPAV